MEGNGGLYASVQGSPSPQPKISETIKRYSRKCSRVLIFNFKTIAFSALFQNSEEKIQCCPWTHALYHEDKAPVFYVSAGPNLHISAP
jgi:hypothetical protein